MICRKQYIIQGNKIVLHQDISAPVEKDSSVSRQIGTAFSFKQMWNAIKT
jgi:hypothetical protein